MTRADLYDWLRIECGCITQPIGEHTRGNVVIIRDPKNNRTAFLDTPIDGRPVNDYTACHICCLLGVQIPDGVKDFEDITVEIKKRHYPDY
jgi:hypothetical protein